ncbi:alpha chain of tryptophan synthase, partial [Helicosporidium sp. ATCC 50920]
TVEAIAAVGARGLLVPDIPLEETSEVRAACAARGVDLVLLTTPTTPPERARRIAEATAGFLYLVSVTGVTGTQAKVSSRVPELLRELKRATDKPVAVGFGVSRPEHCREIAAAGAEGVICGSALVRALGGEGRVARTPEEARRGVEDMARLARELIAAL